MTFREERVAKNEASAREINERIEESYESHPVDSYTNVVCECGLADCDVFLRVTKAEYEDIRADARQFVIVREHLIPDVEERRPRDRSIHRGRQARGNPRRDRHEDGSQELASLGSGAYAARKVAMSQDPARGVVHETVVETVPAVLRTLVAAIARESGARTANPPVADAPPPLSPLCATAAIAHSSA